MIKAAIVPPKGELRANEITIYYDNVCDETGKKLVKTEKRSRIRELMYELFENEDKNKCILKDGRVVPIVVQRREYHRPAFCCLNTVDAPKDEILRAFACKTNISYKKENYPPKKEGELIVNDILYLIGDIVSNNVKVSGIKKYKELKRLFKQLAENPKDNICKLPTGEEVPIIVKRVSDNNIVSYCLNTSEHRKVILREFAKKTGCTYFEEKENDIKPLDKKLGELTARDCYRFLHSVQDMKPQSPKDDSSTRLVEWFNTIYNNHSLNSVVLPNGETHPLVVHRTSHSQRCICLNTSDEKIKPFVIKRMAEITKATINIDNIPINNTSAQELVCAIKLLNMVEEKTKSEDRFYESYKQKVYEELSTTDKEVTVNEWIKNKFKKNR